MAATTPLPSTSAPPIVIECRQGFPALRLDELWRYRELIYFMVWRDLRVRYAQAVLGIGWAILVPAFQMIVFSVFFGRVARIPSDGMPYPLFSYCALVPWSFFANGLTQSSNSIVGSAHLITKVYFPRMAIPIAAVLSGVLDFLLAFLLLVAMLLYYAVEPTSHVVWVPAFWLLAIVTCLGAGLWLTALNVEFRDVRHMLPFLTQLWFCATPVTYPASLLHGPWRIAYALNPMVGVVEGFRWALLGRGSAPGVTLLVSTAAAIVMLVSGAYQFRRMERRFADVL